MWNDEHNHSEVGQQSVKETQTSYEEAAKEFAVSAAEFLQHIALLTQARDAYQLALAISAHLRETLDSGDETLRSLKAQLEHAVGVLGNDAADQKKLETVKLEAVKKVETIRAIGEKADVARA